MASVSPINLKRLAPAERREVLRTLCWTRTNGGTVTCLMMLSDCRPCVTGGLPIEYIKRLSGRRPRHYRGFYVNPPSVLQQLPADVWCEIVPAWAGGAS